MVKLNNIIVSNFLDVNMLNGQKKFFFMVLVKIFEVSLNNFFLCIKHTKIHFEKKKIPKKHYVVKSHLCRMFFMN